MIRYYLFSDGEMVSNGGTGDYKEYWYGSPDGEGWGTMIGTYGGAGTGFGDRYFDESGDGPNGRA